MSSENRLLEPLPAALALLALLPAALALLLPAALAAAFDCAVVCAFFIGVRHEWLGSRLTQQTLGLLLDKWSIGPLRVLNLVAFTIVLYWLRKPVLRLVAVEPFLTLGKASLEVFCAHIFFVFFGLALLYGEVTQLHGYLAIGLLVFTFTGLILVALREVRRRRDEKERAASEDKPEGPNLPIPPAVSRFAE